MYARWGHFLRISALLIAAYALAFSPVAAGAKSKPKRAPFNKTEVLLQWINEYRHNPEPNRLAGAYKAMRDLTLLKDVDEASRNFAWWGQAGQTALSLGCVAAAVGGQATAEIPCVVGSAMSTAGLKYLAPSP